VSKFDDPDFFPFLQRYDFVCLTETFIDDPDFSVNTDYFKSFMSPARKLCKQGRKSGGVICLVKNHLARHFTTVKCSFDNVVILRADKELLCCNSDVLFFGVYVPPSGSTYYDMYDVSGSDGICFLEDCLIELTARFPDCNIIMCGDFNARTGSMSPNFASDIYDLNVDVCHHTRLSEDTVINPFGRSLLSLCLEFELEIINGVVGGACGGKYTNISVHGNSVIDYFLVTCEMISNCVSLTVVENVLSSHMGVELLMHSKVRLSEELTSTDSKCERFIWNDEYAEQFHRNVYDMIESGPLSDINHIDDVNGTVDLLTDNLLEAAIDMKKTFFCHKQKRKREWYDSECVQAKKTVTKLLHKYSRTRGQEDKHVYIEQRRMYKKLNCSKKRRF